MGLEGDVNLKKCDIIERLIVIVGEGNIKIDEPMRNHTSFKIGGPADIFVSPSDKYQIRNVLKLCHDSGCPVFIMGNGTNLLVKDGGIRGVVLKIYDNFNKIDVEGKIVRAQAGALLSVISKSAMKHSLKGFEFASGIPGTLGGAAAMNAGAYGGEIKDVIYSVEVIDDNFNIVPLRKDELEFGYRTSVVSRRGYTVLEAAFHLEEGNYDEIKERIDTLTRRRKEKQPLHLPSAGSVFKRPEGYFAGKLIEDSGLKGIRVGGAMVSDMHSNFIVNVGNATAKDVLNLIEIVRHEVYEKFNLLLEPEIKVVGEESK